MDATQGFKGVGTFIFILLTLWLTWPFTSAIVDTPDDTVQNFLFWGSFILMALVTLILTPFLIISTPESETNLLGALSSVGIWFGMLLLNLLLFPIFNVLTNIFSNIQLGNASTILVDTLQEGTLIIQLISLLYLLITVITLYIVPTLVALKPEAMKDLLKRFFT